MGWAFLFVVAAMLVWLFMDSGRTRMAALGLIGFAAAVAGVFFLVLDAPDRREGTRRVIGADVSETAAQRAKIERSRTALTPARIAMTTARLTPGAETYWGSDGKQHDRQDLFSWTFQANVKNLSDEFAARDIHIHIRLFSCPSFFTTPAEAAVIDELQKRCALIGERTTGFYDVNLKASDSTELKETVTFDNQPEPRNWRYWADVARVDALIQ